MKSTNFLLLLLFVFSVACNKIADDIISPERQTERQNEFKDLSPGTIAILNDAKKDIPIDASHGIGIGVLARERSKSRCLVGYYNDNIYEVYSFTLVGNTWTRGEQVEQHDLSKPSLGKAFAYTKKIADLYYGYPTYQLRDTWYVPGNQITTGEWTYEEEYVTNKPTRGDFYNGTDVNNGKEWKVNFKKWEWWIYSLPQQFQYQTTTNISAFFEFFYNGQWYRGADKVKGTYQLTVTEITPPSIPNLNSPSDGACVNPSVTFSWSASSGTPTITYQLQVDDQSNFSSPFYDQGSLSSTSQAVNGLSNNTTYYWRVRASNPGGTSDWSNVRTVNIKPITPSQPYITGSVNGQGQPHLSWAAVPNATIYYIYKNGGYYDSTTETSFDDWYEGQVYTYGCVSQEGSIQYVVKAVNEGTSCNVESIHSNTIFFCPVE